MMLKLTYTRKKDQFQTVTVLGDPKGIKDLYWQLTQNYKCEDGTAIGDIIVSNLNGDIVTDSVLSAPYLYSTHLSELED